jgi:hypothetical protein
MGDRPLGRSWPFSMPTSLAARSHQTGGPPSSMGYSRAYSVPEKLTSSALVGGCTISGRMLTSDLRSRWTPPRAGGKEKEAI